MANQRLSFYKGSYVVELQPGAAKSHLPLGVVTICGDIISVPRGTVQQVVGGIQFYADNKPFSWGYKFIRRIRGAKGEILWQNWDIKS